MTTDPVLKLKDVAKITGLSRHTLTAHLKAGRLKGMRTKGTTGEWRIRQSWVDEWLEQGAKQYVSEIARFQASTTSSGR